MFVSRQDERVEPTDYGGALETQRLDDDAVRRRLLGHVVLTLLLVALAVMAIWF